MVYIFLMLLSNCKPFILKAALPKQQEAGQTVAQIAWEHGISESTFYTWKSKYGGLQVSELTARRPCRSKELEEENRRLKQMYADLSLENQAIKAVLRKK